MKKGKKLVGILLSVMILLCCVPIVQVGAYAQIPEDAVEFNGHYYKVYETKMSWYSAKEHCEELEGHLVTITSQEENDFVFDLVKNSGIIKFSIGFTDKDEEGNWVWITGENAEYKNWGVKQPDDNSNYDGQDFATIVTQDDSETGCKAGQWDDTSNYVDNELEYVKSFICEWDEKNFPNGYSFDEDSYGFSNYTTTFGLSKKYFTTMYEEASGKLLYSKKKNVSNGGLCYGMAYTTAAIFNGFPSVTTIYNGADEKRNSLREVKKTDYIKLRGGPISIDSYIKYAFIYQWSNEEVGNSLDAAIRDTLENNQLKCVIEINRWKTDNNGNFKLDKNGDKIPDGGHAVLFVGAAEIGNETIYYVNDSNSTKLEAITFKDGGWSYSKPWSGKVDNTNSTLSFSDAVNDPYLILNSGLKATVKQGITNNTSSTIEEVNEIYIEGMDRVNKDKMLLSIDSTDFELSTEDFIDISNVNFSESENEYENLTNLYWINNDNTVTISDLSDENNIIELAGDNTILSANVSQNSTVTMTIDTQNIEADIETKKGEDFTISVETIINDREIVAKVNGISDAETITATQTETGLLVTGISDGTVTLTKDEEVIATQEITNADSDIQINYDADGTSDDLDVEYESISDNNADDNSNNCSHICHKTGFMGFIWKIIRFFCKLFKANHVCDCGIAHY